MLKGNERKVIMIKGGHDSFYDMACIFIKSSKCDITNNDDVVKFAEQIIENALADDHTLQNKSQKSPLFTKKRSLLIIGMLLGSAISMLTYLLVCMLFFY